MEVACEIRDVEGKSHTIYKLDGHEIEYIGRKRYRAGDKKYHFLREVVVDILTALRSGPADEEVAEVVKQLRSAATKAKKESVPPCCSHKRVVCLDCMAEGTVGHLFTARPRKRSPKGVEQSRLAAEISREKRKKKTDKLTE